MDEEDCANTIMFDQVSLHIADANYLIVCPQDKEIRDLLAMC